MSDKQRDDKRRDIISLFQRFIFPPIIISCNYRHVLSFSGQSGTFLINKSTSTINLKNYCHGKNQSKTISRRSFIGKSSTAIAGLTIIPSYAISGLGHTVPSDKLNVAGIGIGGMDPCL